MDLKQTQSKPSESTPLEDFHDLMLETSVQPYVGISSVNPTPQPDPKKPSFLRRFWFLVVLLLLLLLGSAAYALFCFGILDLSRPQAAAVEVDVQSYRVDPASLVLFGEGSRPGNIFDISQNGIYYAGVDGGMLVTDNIVTGKRLGSIVYNSPVKVMALSPGGGKVASVLEDGSLFLQAVESGDVLTLIRDLFIAPGALKFSQDGAVVAAGGTNGDLIVLRVKDGEILYQQKWDNPILLVDVLSNPPVLVVGLEDSRVIHLNYGTKTDPFTLFTGVENKQILLTPSGNQVVVLDDERLSLWNPGSSTSSWTSIIAKETQCIIASESSLICGLRTQLSVWDVSSGSQMQSLDTEISISRMKILQTAHELTIYSNLNQVHVYKLVVVKD